MKQLFHLWALGHGAYAVCRLYMFTRAYFDPVQVPEISIDG